MQILIHSNPQTFQPNEFVIVTFTNDVLRTYLKGQLTDERDAKIGEIYYVTPNGQTAYPTVEKGFLPESRGKRLCWCLSFCEPVKHADSYEDFLNRAPQIQADYNSSENHIYCVKDRYAFLVAKKRPQARCRGKKAKNKIKPLFAWISDDITDEELSDLLNEYHKYRNVSREMLQFMKNV